MSATLEDVADFIRTKVSKLDVVSQMRRRSLGILCSCHHSKCFVISRAICIFSATHEKEGPQTRGKRWLVVIVAISRRSSREWS